MTRFLTDAQVNECVGLDDILPAIESMVANYGDGQAANLTRRRLSTQGSYLAVMGGALIYDGVFGVKTFTNTRNGYSFQVSLYDANSGELLLYTQANRLGQLRTGSTTGVAVKHLANEGPLTVGIVGTGNQAGDQLRAVSLVREIGEVRAFSRNAENRQAFAALGWPRILAFRSLRRIPTKKRSQIAMLLSPSRRPRPRWCMANGSPRAPR